MKHTHIWCDIDAQIDPHTEQLLNGSKNMA